MCRRNRHFIRRWRRHLEQHQHYSCYHRVRVRGCYRRVSRYNHYQLYFDHDRMCVNKKFHSKCVTISCNGIRDCLRRAHNFSDRCRWRHMDEQRHHRGNSGFRFRCCYRCFGRDFNNYLCIAPHRLLSATDCHCESIRTDKRDNFSMPGFDNNFI